MNLEEMESEAVERTKRIKSVEDALQDILENFPAHEVRSGPLADRWPLTYSSAESCRRPPQNR